MFSMICRYVCKRHAEHGDALADAGIDLLGDDMKQEQNTLVVDIVVDEAKEKPASDAPQKPLAKEELLPSKDTSFLRANTDAPQKPLAKEELFPRKNTAFRRAKSEEVGCFNLQGLFTNSRKK